jgi:hypothetical protein
MTGLVIEADDPIDNRFRRGADGLGLVADADS